ncbi:hypothetical protein C2845_PM18G12000 [Panicum miliaceum]|uniref:Uncharacterized protein n=1 Tax=Panicum miliaceum TaxID=4540 RepID=A0A3L6PLI1_PANMI|nr:hypothetical protein C2845_PM18G12000 [Panicum miliaceum]
MEEKLQEMLRELEALLSRKAEMEVKVGSLEAALSAAIARNSELESEVDEMKMEMPAARKEVERLQAEVAEAVEKHSAAVAEAARLRSEIDKVVKANEAAAAAHDTDKRRLEAELEALKGEVGRIQAEKDASLDMAEVEGKGFKISDLNGELEQLQLAVAEAQRRGKNEVWRWLGPATTTVLAAASFVYAARSR